MSIRKKTETGDIIIAGKGKDATGDFVVTPQVAEVGQILSVKAVDASGKPTEWECVQPGGGSDNGLVWFVIDDVNYVKWNTSKSGRQGIIFGGFIPNNYNTFYPIMNSNLSAGMLSVEYNGYAGGSYTRSNNFYSGQRSASYRCMFCISKNLADYYEMEQLK